MKREGTSHMYICIHSPVNSPPIKLPHNIEQSCMCYTVGFCWLSILNKEVCKLLGIFSFHVGSCLVRPLLPLCQLSTPDAIKCKVRTTVVSNTLFFNQKLSSIVGVMSLSIGNKGWSWLDQIQLDS